MCETMQTYIMKRNETPEDVKGWFVRAIQGLWPVATGSLSLRKCPCIREHCAACESGEGHSSYAIYGRQGDRRFSIYVPDNLVVEVQQAITNGRLMHQLINEAGQRYTRALKTEKRSRARK